MEYRELKMYHAGLTLSDIMFIPKMNLVRNTPKVYRKSQLAQRMSCLLAALLEAIIYISDITHDAHTATDYILVQTNPRHTGRYPWPRGLKTLVCGRSPAENAGSNPVGDMDVYLLWGLCVFR
jgi:hypothetical protein